MRRDDVDPELNTVTGHVLAAAIDVHREFGPGLLESVYEESLEIALRERGLSVERKVRIPLVFRGRPLKGYYEIDLRVNGRVIVELKAVEHVNDVHLAQLRSYLKLTCERVGLLINFNQARVKDGIYRVVYSADGIWKSDAAAE